MAMAGKDRVQKYRNNLRKEGCARLEVWIGLGPIQDLRDTAKRKKLEVWEAVQEAVQAYVAGNREFEKQSKSIPKESL